MIEKLEDICVNQVVKNIKIILELNQNINLSSVGDKKSKKFMS